MGKFLRARQGRWDKRHLVTVSTHLTRREYDVLMGVCAAMGTRPYALVRDYLREYCASASRRLAYEGTPIITDDGWRDANALRCIAKDSFAEPRIAQHPLE